MITLALDTTEEAAFLQRLLEDPFIYAEKCTPTDEELREILLNRVENAQREGATA